MKSYRLNRLFNARSGRCFDVAVDHGFFTQPGFLQGIEDMRKVLGHASIGTTQKYFDPSDERTAGIMDKL